MAEDAARNVRLRKNARLLLLQYVRCSDGFRPSRQYLAERMNIGKEHINRLRWQLVEHRLIHYDEENRKIYIDWYNICAFAMLCEPIRNANIEYFNATRNICQPNTPINKTREYREYRINGKEAALTDAQRHTLEHIESMTPNEFEAWIHDDYMEGMK